MEHGGVGGIGLILPEHPAGGQNADGGLGVFHDPNLHGAGLGPQQHGIVIGEIEGVGAVPGGMALFDVQPCEVVVRQLHLRAFNNLVAHAHKGVLDLLEHLVHRMLMAHAVALAGDGHVDGLGGELCLQSGGVDGGLALFQLLLNGRADGVGHLAHDRPLLGAELTHLL